MQSCVSTPSIVLTAHEEEIVSVLLEAAQPAAAAESESSPSQRQSQSQVVVRIAGGWVRDKLLGFESDDIDVALENCSGEIRYLLYSPYVNLSVGFSVSAYVFPRFITSY